ncbi:MAG TPA: xanthine dehydrogenase family protein subunit M [Rhodanobacteraceae bacterium]|nr:xanthine dehydrogenase family protein subunit M [Rhodanobacteraceae bacterium]
MNAFRYVRADSTDAAIHAARDPAAMFIGGGTNLLDLVKSDVEHPATLIDINRLDLAAIAPLPGGGLRIGALARNSDTANHAEVRRRYPLLVEALLAGASPQLRNMATTGGNLLQRTRCYYFVDPGFAHCNKRVPGSGCAAREGCNRIHAILGASEQCIATHPSDMCVALAALDAVVRVRGGDGERSIPFARFHRLPGDDPTRDTTIAQGELITAVDLPAKGFAGHSHYLKLRDRASFAFALVSVAAALELDDGVVREARIALGGVAHKPWRATEAEQGLVGKRLEPAVLDASAKLALADARPYRDNAFKVELAKRAIVRALQTAGGVA